MDAVQYETIYICMYVYESIYVGVYVLLQLSVNVDAAAAAAANKIRSKSVVVNFATKLLQFVATTNKQASCNNNNDNNNSHNNNDHLMFCFRCVFHWLVIICTLGRVYRVLQVLNLISSLEHL